jgi:hypothetical protein
LEGIIHINKCSHNKASFDFEDRERLCFDGLVFSLADGTLDSRPFIEPDRPLRLPVKDVPAGQEPTQEAVIRFIQISCTLPFNHRVKNTGLPDYFLVRMHWLELSCC